MTMIIIIVIIYFKQLSFVTPFHGDWPQNIFHGDWAQNTFFFEHIFQPYRHILNSLSLLMQIPVWISRGSRRSFGSDDYEAAAAAPWQASVLRPVKRIKGKSHLLQTLLLCRCIFTHLKGGSW